MANARTEFLAHILGVGEISVVCAQIRIHRQGEDAVYSLVIGHTPEEWEDFTQSLDFSYDNGYGGQNLFGTIWFNDGSFSDRGEYDGSEWWEHRSRPVIPDDLGGRYEEI